MWKFVILISLAFVSIVIICSIGCDAAPNPIPFSDVKLQSENYSVDSSPYSLSFLEINGEVCSKYCCIERHTAYLTAEQSEGWEVDIVPSVIPFIICSTEKFTVLVIVPPGVEPGPRELTIHVTMCMPGLAPQRSNATCTIMVMGYHRLSIEAVHPVINISDDEEVGLSVYVANIGTLDAQFAFHLMLDGEEISPRGVPPFLDIPAGDRRLVRMWLDLSGLVEGRSEELEIGIKPYEEGGNWTPVVPTRQDADTVNVIVWDRRWRFSDSTRDLESIIGYLLVLELSMLVVAVGLWRQNHREG